MSYYVQNDNLSVVKSDVYEIEYTCEEDMSDKIEDWIYKKYISTIDLSHNSVSIHDLSRAKVSKNCIINISTYYINFMYEYVYNHINYKYMIVFPDKKMYYDEEEFDCVLSEDIIFLIKKSKKSTYD